MLGLINRKILRNTVCVGRIGVVPAGFEFVQGQRIGPVAIDLVGRHVDERRFRAGAPSGFQQVQRPHRVGVKIVERNCGRTIMRRLGGGVNDAVRLQPGDQVKDGLAVTDVELVVNKAGKLRGEPRLVPAGIARFAKENRPLVVIHAVESETHATEIKAHLGADEPG